MGSNQTKADADFAFIAFWWAQAGFEMNALDERKTFKGCCRFL